MEIRKDLIAAGMRRLNKDQEPPDSKIIADGYPTQRQTTILPVSEARSKTTFAFLSFNC